MLTPIEIEPPPTITKRAVRAGISSIAAIAHFPAHDLGASGAWIINTPQDFITKQVAWWYIYQQFCEAYHEIYAAKVIPGSRWDVLIQLHAESAYHIALLGAYAKDERCFNRTPDFVVETGNDKSDKSPVHTRAVS